MVNNKEFGGDKKTGESILRSREKAFVERGTPKIPSFIETYHLTFLTILWSSLNILSGYLARSDVRWLWIISLSIALQYLTDLFDGAVGRKRGTGLVKWGYYMDHFLDYIFLCALVLAYFLISPPELGFYFLILLILLAGFLVSTFLRFAATNEFQVYYFRLGPTEMRIAFIIFNTAVIVSGTKYFPIIIPVICAICFIALTVLVIRTGNELWKTDMKEKNQR